MLMLIPILATLTSQMPFVKFKLTMKEATYAQSKHIVDYSNRPTTLSVEKLTCEHPELHQNNARRNQGCGDLSRRCVEL